MSGLANSALTGALTRALEAGERGVRALTAVQASELDPLRLALPAMPPTGEAFLTKAAVDALAALYLHAELEQAGALRTVEGLAAARRRLNGASRDLATRLEAFADTARRHMPQQSRDDLFARTFGIGPAARAVGSSPSNLAFTQSLGRLAAALVVVDEDRRAEGHARVTSEARLRIAATALANVLAPHRGGHVFLAAQRLQRRFREAFQILGHAELRTALGTRSAWESLERLAGPVRPDARACVERATNGQELLGWLSEHLEALSAPERPLEASPRIVLSATRWLVTYGAATREGAA